MGIEFKEAKDNPPKKVLKIIPAQAYFVNYTDGIGRAATRVAFRIDGSKNTYLLSEKISGDLVVKEASGWLHTEFVKALKREGHEGPVGGAESL
jgi:hypothetical protein